MRKGWTRGAILALVGVVGTALGASWGHAAGSRDETVLTVKVSSAEHEAQEGYFTLGDSATVMAKPGSELFKFLSRHRGRSIRITLTDASRPDPARLERQDPDARTRTLNPER